MNNAQLELKHYKEYIKIIERDSTPPTNNIFILNLTFAICGQYLKNGFTD